MVYINPQNNFFPIINPVQDALAIGMLIPPGLTYNQQVQYVLNNVSDYKSDIQKPKNKLSYQLPITIDELAKHRDVEIIKYYKYVPEKWLTRDEFLKLVREWVYDDITLRSSR